MGYQIGYDERNKRDIGYGVPAICDHPECNTKIDRGLAFVCKNQEPYGGEGCGLFFCSKHHGIDGCERCEKGKEPFEPKNDTKEWIEHKLNDESWGQWRNENPEEVSKYNVLLKKVI